ncbi:MAG: (2Fe-2S) ferredoxin domain-containing protein, partial [Clostridia bacterium]
MKSLAELEAIRAKTLEKVSMRKDADDGIRVVVGMATCGIAAGARPVMLKFLEEIQKRNLQNVTVSQTGCIGMCRLEPMLDVMIPGKGKVTYVR